MTLVNWRYIDTDSIPETGILLGSKNGISEHLLPDGRIDITDCYDGEE